MAGFDGVCERVDGAVVGVISTRRRLDRYSEGAFAILLILKG